MTSANDLLGGVLHIKRWLNQRGLLDGVEITITFPNVPAQQDAINHLLSDRDVLGRAIPPELRKKLATGDVDLYGVPVFLRSK